MHQEFLDNGEPPAARLNGDAGTGNEAPPVGSARRGPKLSVSLYQRDLARLDEIKEFLRRHGHRNRSDSEALRLACRAVEVGEHLLPLYEEMQREDRRRKH